MNKKIKKVSGTRRFIRPILVFLLLLGYSSCTAFNLKENDGTPGYKGVDRSFETGEPCAAPCWYGLRLGESTIDDIRMTLSKLPFVDTSTITEYSYGEKQIDFGFDCFYYYGHDSGSSCGSLETDPNGKLKTITVTIHYPLTLQSLIEKLGLPDYYVFDPSPNNDSCIIGIYWSKKNIATLINDDTTKKICGAAKNGDFNMNQKIGILVYAQFDIQQLQEYDASPWPNP